MVSGAQPRGGPVEPIAIVYPAIAMFALTLSMIGALAVARIGAVRRREISIGYYRAYEGSQPPRLHLLGRHVQNHFEVPPIFYAGVLFTLVTGTVTALSVALAWGFVVARCVHSFIHLGGNDVSRRFFAYAVSLLFLAGLWGALLVALLRWRG
jgi:hypothetical protein